MEILNKNGMILMDYRREFKRHYADSVDEALKDAILTLYKEGQIPEKLFRIILDDNVDDSVVYTYLLSRREFTKSSMELNSEFNEVREKVNEYLIKINFVDNVCTKNSINTNRIYVIKQYDIPKELLLSYFGLTPSEIIPLMRRKGFMDKFCVLRLSQAFKEIYSELKVPEHIDHGYSLIYYNKLIQGFSIDYKYMVNINYINDEEHLSDVLDKIKVLDAEVEEKFKTKVSYSYFQELGKKMSGAELQMEIEKIVIPVRSGKRSQDIRRPEFVIEDAVESKVEEPIVVESVVEKKDEPKVAAPVFVVDEEDDMLDEESTSQPQKKEQANNSAPQKPVEKPVVNKPTEQKTQEQPKQPQKQEQKKPDNQPKKQEQGKPQQQNQPKPEQKKPDNQPKQNQQNQQKQNQPKQDKSQNQSQKPQQQNQPKQEQKKPDNQPKREEPKKVDDKPIEKIEEKPKQEQKPEQKKPEQKPQQQNQPKPEQKKPVVDDDDDDDLFGEKPVAKPEEKKDNKKPSESPKAGKPVLIIDDSDLDMI